jgi:hypothetical protein
MERRGHHYERREAAYRRAADAHRRAAATEITAADFFDAQGDTEAAARHRNNAAVQHHRADEDYARATAVTVVS